MDHNIVTALVAGLSAVFGSAITGYFTVRAQHRSNQTLIEIENIRSDNKEKSAYYSLQLTALKTIYKALTSVDREFSTSRAVSILDSKQCLMDFDNFYFDQCEKIDDARFYAHTYAAEISEDFEKIYSSMNIYWGNLRNAITNELMGVPRSQTENLINNAVNESMNIGAFVRSAKVKVKPA